MHSYLKQVFPRLEFPEQDVLVVVESSHGDVESFVASGVCVWGQHFVHAIVQQVHDVEAGGHGAQDSAPHLHRHVKHVLDSRG